MTIAFLGVSNPCGGLETVVKFSVVVVVVVGTLVIGMWLVGVEGTADKLVSIDVLLDWADSC